MGRYFFAGKTGKGEVQFHGGSHGIKGLKIPADKLALSL
jgi:hypothetical protein